MKKGDIEKMIKEILEKYSEFIKEGYPFLALRLRKELNYWEYRLETKDYIE